ncbi:hypothetical protein EFD56_26610 [Rhizobium phaseoli]|nr:hypothetical protein EFD56_26610 [Rhizobium phaseoli]
MENLPIARIAVHDVEILPPEREDNKRAGFQCLCCGRPAQAFDDDGCGICDECLAPSVIGGISGIGVRFQMTEIQEAGRLLLDADETRIKRPPSKYTGDGSRSSVGIRLRQSRPIPRRPR